MAIIHGRKPEGDPPKAKLHVVVKLAEVAAASRTEMRSAGLSELARAAPDAKFSPYFEEGLRAMADTPFDRYLAAEVKDHAAGQALVQQLAKLKIVEVAYVEPGPVPPPVNAADDPRSSSQGYLDAAPGGIDARWLWQFADGNGIGFVDAEQGWTLNHEDLVAAGITIISGVSNAYQGHGTAVLGEVVASDNTIGGIGIAPRAKARTVSEWRTASVFNRAAAILSAGQNMIAGDVLLLESQTSFNGVSLGPSEIEPAVFDAIRKVVDDGIIVVEAGGNGSNDLDSYRDTAGKAVLDRSSADFKDSGAIMVGAASSTVPHSRLGFSNHGSRIDCYGWGENIDTTGDGWQGTSTTIYTTSFGGTSGASPIVTGSALLLQSWRKANNHPVYSPDYLRGILTSNINTPSANPATDRIGVMPNLRAIVEAESGLGTFNGNRHQYLSLVYILIGLIDDSPGVIWVPGKGPVPVDPGWGRRLAEIKAPKRDLLAAMAVNEIAGLISDSATRVSLTAAAVDAMHAAADRIGRMR
jgi:hypothetical protein